MVDKSVFSRLKRLFSTDIVIRNVGGNQLRVVDVDKIQSLGIIKTNSLIDRFTKLYSTTGTGIYNLNNLLSYQTLRVQLYSDYEAMDTDAIIASTLDIISDECTLKDESGEILHIRSSDENIQKILYNLFYDVLNIEFNLWSWVRQMCKYGDFYLKLEIAESFGVYNVIPYSAYNIIREEGIDPENPSYVRFRYDPNALAGGPAQQSVLSNPHIPAGTSITFENYEMGHFRLIADANFLPYGRCLHPETKIYTKNNIKEIKDIVKGDKVWTYNIEENKYELANVLATKNSGIKKLYKIKTRHNEIKATDNHPILIWNLELNKPLYKQVRDLNKGDYVCSYKNISFELNNPKLNKDIIIDETKRNQFLVDRTPLNSFPDIVTPEFAKFWGFMLGDGWENPTCSTIGFARGIRENLNEYYENLLKKYSGKEKLNIIKSKTSRVQISGVSVNSTIFHRLMSINGYVGKSYSKRLPKWIYECDEDTQLSLIKGLMDADGYISTDKWGVNSYNLTLNNKELLNDVKTLLDRLKIKTGSIRNRKYNGKCTIKGVEYNSKQAYDFTFYLDGNKKQQYKKYNKINSKYDIELFKVESIIEDLPEETYDIQVDINSNFIANGMIVHNSYIEPARKTWKQYVLLEDAMMVHRIMRAPEKRMFYINIGNIPPHEVEAYMQKIIQTQKKVPYQDPQTGQYNLKFNLQNMMEDFYVPVRGNDQTTKIETVKGLEYTGIEDVEYLREKLFAALKVPKAFMGYEKDLCISPETKIPLLDGRTISVKEIIDEFNLGKKNYVYSIDEETKNIVPGEIEWAGFTRLNTETVKVWLDNNKFIQCTPDHLFMARNGEWKEAQNLIEGESLMPIYLKKSTNKSINGYTQVYNPSTGKYEYVHRLVADYFDIKKSGKVIHHKDFDKLNNNPENLDCSMNFWEHSKYHALNNQNTLQKWIKINGASRKGFVKNPKGICKGCSNIFDKTKLKSSERNNIYCSNQCKQNNWKTKYKNINLDILIENAKDCQNFKELKDKLNIKDHTTLRKVFENLKIDKSQFIIENMPFSHGNKHFMNQLPETNKFYKEFKNHKVVRIEKVEELIDTCDLTISKYHNFGTEDVIIHNSGKATLAAEDIRFARTIERLQRIVLSELKKIALVHLYTQGYDGEAMTNFELSLTTPSIIYDQERVALLKEKVDLASQILDAGLLPTDWIYDNIFHFSEDKFEEFRDLIAEDKKRQFRYGQIENEGNDPAESGKSYGTPHDLASLYGKSKAGPSSNVPPGYNEMELGRPKDAVSNINTQMNPFGKDRLGNQELTDPIGNDGETGGIMPGKKVAPLALETKAAYLRNKKMLESIPRSKKIIYEGKNHKDMLDESNLLPNIED